MKRVYVKNLKLDITKEQLDTVIRKFGEIKYSNLSKQFDRERSFAIFQFENAEDAKKIIDGAKNDPEFVELAFENYFEIGYHQTKDERKKIIHRKNYQDPRHSRKQPGSKGGQMNQQGNMSQQQMMQLMNQLTQFMMMMMQFT